jgi:hypothetical protein
MINLSGSKRELWQSFYSAASLWSDRDGPLGELGPKITLCLRELVQFSMAKLLFGGRALLQQAMMARSCWWRFFRALFWGPVGGAPTGVLIEV